MATKKTTYDDLSPNFDDLDFDMADLDPTLNGRDKKADKNRKPIVKVAKNVAKGSLGHFASESFVRNTISRGLPGGYAVASDFGFEIRDTASQLYNTASQEARKFAPTARRIVGRMMPTAQAIMPKKLSASLDRFAKGGPPIAGQQPNADEEALRSVMGELTMTTERERMRERAEDAARGELQEQINTRRFNTQLKATASIDARLAQLNAFNDQVMARAQRRLLEVNYRQYFTMRDMLKLHGTEMAAQRELLTAVVHNTALPDMVKAKAREVYGQGLRERFNAVSQNALMNGTGHLLRQFREKAGRTVKNAAGGFGGFLGGADMLLDSLDMGREMGMDVSAESSKMFGAAVAASIANLAASAIGKGFDRNRFTAQQGSKLGRFMTNVPGHLRKWGRSATMQGGLLGAAIQMAKDHIPQNGVSRRIGGSGLHDAHDAGMLTKKAQRSIEEIMPGYLSMILHELKIQRQGAGAERTVWNDDKGVFTTEKQRNKDIDARLFNSQQAQFSRERAEHMASQLYAGSKVSPAVFNATVKQIISDKMNRKEFDPKKYMKPGADMKYLHEHRKAVRQATKGRFKGANKRTDQVELEAMNQIWHSLDSSIHDVGAVVGAYDTTGNRQYLIDRGYASQEGDDIVQNLDALVEQLAGVQGTSEHVSPYRRGEMTGTFGNASAFDIFSDRRVDLYKKGNFETPVIYAKRVGNGSYRSASTGKAIRTMAQVLEGVIDGVSGQLIVTDKQAAQLVTAADITLTEHLKRQSSGKQPGFVKRARNWAEDKGAGVASGIDDFFEHGHGKKLRTKKGRADLVNTLKKAGKRGVRKAKVKAGRAAQTASPHVQRAYEAAAAHAAPYVGPGTVVHSTVMLMGHSASDVIAQGKAKAAEMKEAGVKGSLQHAAAAAAPWQSKLAEEAKKGWGKMISASRMGLDLYLSGELKPRLTEEGLKAGAYVSAKTGKTITDLRQIADGVMDQHGGLLVSAEQAVTQLHADGGQKFEELMTQASNAVEAVKANPTVAGVAQKATSSVAAAKAAVLQGVSHFSPLHQAAASAAAAAHEAVNNAIHGGPTAEAETKEPLVDIVNAFKEGNFQRLEALLAAVQLGGSGGGGAAPGAPAGKKTGIFGMMGKAIGASWSGAKWYGNYVKNVLKLQGRAIGGMFSGAGWLAGKVFGVSKTLNSKEPMDVFVKGERSPRLIKGQMEAGAYFNVDKDGKPTSVIKTPADIKGPVIDNTGNTLISIDDYKKGLTDRTGKSLAMKALSGAFSLAGKAAGFLGGYYGLVFKGMGWLAKTGLGVITGGSGQAIDVYVRGDMKGPRLFATGMRAGSYVSVKNPRKKIRGVNDIDGPVADASDNGNILISEQDLVKGLVDRKGKPLKVKKNLLHGLASGALSLAGNLGMGYLKVLGSMAKAGGALATLPFRLIAGMFGGGFGGGKKMPKGGFPTTDEKTHSLLTEVLHMLDARLPESEHYRAGSWQEMMAKRRGKSGADHSVHAEQKHAPGLFGKLKKLLGYGDDEDGGHDGGGGGTNIDIGGYGGGGGLGNGKDARGRKRGGWRRNLEARRARAARAKGLKWNRAGAGAKKAGWLSRLGGKFGRFKPRGGGKVGALLGIAGGLGMGALADKLGPDSMAGKALDVAGTASTLWSGARLAGSLLGGTGALSALGGAASTIGGGIATGAGMLAEGALAAGGALASVLSAPVVLGALAVAAVGTAAYAGYKYYNLKKKAPFRKLRMAQYGVDMNKDVWPAGKVQKLEELLMPHLIISGGKAMIDAKGVDKDAILKLFDLEKSWYNPTGWFHKKNMQDVSNNQNFFSWFARRFQPIFCNWAAAVHQLAPKMGLSDVDSEMSIEQKRSLYKQVMTVDPSLYGLTDSPFGTDPLNAGKAEVDAAALEVTKDFGDDDKKKTSEAAKGTAAALLASKGVSAAVGPDGKPVAQAGDAKAGAGSLAAAMKNTTGEGAGSKVGLSQQSNLKPSLGFLGGQVSALMAVRYKTYGLTDMEPSKVKALFLLETDVFDKITYDGHGTAKFDDDASYYFNTYAGYFGVSATDEAAKTRWYAWFAKRFVPTVLQFSTAVKHANKTTDPRDADNYLSPDHLLDVANTTVAATFSSGMLTSASVWTFTDSPFDDKPLNTDSSVTKENIQALKDAVKKRQMDEQKAKESAAKSSIDKAADAKDKANGRPQAANDSDYNQRSKVNAKALPAGMDAGSIAAQKFLETGGATGKAIGQSVQQPGNGTSGDINKIPMPTTSGMAGMKDMLEAVGKMTGIDPAILSTFAGIESGWNPDAAAPTSSAKGLFQFINSTWNAMLTKYAGKYGIDPKTPSTDPRASALMGAEFIKENQKYLAQSLGRQPTDTELYAAHFLGPAGAVQLLKAPDSAIGAAVAPKAAASNAPIFYRSGQALTKAGIMQVLDSKVSKFRKMSSGMSAANVASSGPSAPTTGGNTTTTANGPTGGVGPQQAVASAGGVSASAGASGLAAIKPPSLGGGAGSIIASAGSASGGSVGENAVYTQQAFAQAKATAADRQAQSIGQAQAQTQSDMSDHMEKQTDLQTQMVELLKQAVQHTGALASAGPANGTNVGQVAGGPTINDNQASIPPPQSGQLPNAPVPMRRPQYG